MFKRNCENCSYCKAEEDGLWIVHVCYKGEIILDDLSIATNCPCYERDR